METIDYSTRSDLVAALVDFRKRGIHAEVVHNGRTLSFPEGISDATEEDQQLPPADNEEKVAPADGVEKTPVEGDSLLGVVQPDEGEPLDRSTYTIEGTCSVCGEAAIADPNGGAWIHVEPSTHAPDEGEFVPNEQQDEDEVEDIIGTTGDTPQKTTAKKSRNRSRNNS